ncbi:pullulanase X25 domain-containing protein [Flavobacterium silvaticum]|uniref:SusE outer membrane protein domain-containing protein n=1 Tax=Flavobacterium silvaticum TaxID=1852020 RepID=A0A972JH41_9FLAO|nr:SusE domain-containing protein [Flavobacterium silvaticum]NMH27540.1 hypothetical protein [Flavobacterium silvaticum]
MKKYLNKIMVIAAIAFLGVSCDDAELTTLAKVSFEEPVIATPNTLAITSDNQYQNIVTVSWPHVQFPIDAPVTYKIQFDVATDTIGDNAWENAITLDAGEDVLSKSFLGDEINNMAHTLGLVSDVQGELVVRVEAYMDRSVFSSATTILVVPFTEPIAFGQVYVPGQYQNWQPATAATLAAISSGVYQGFLTFPAGQLEFKFTTGPNWDQPYGGDANGNLTSPGINNLHVPAAGTYQITLNLNTMSYTAVPYSWGVIGTSTVGQWNTDTDMVWDYQNHIWKFTGALVPGALKFRLNDSWTINYGPNNSTDFVVFLDNPGAHTIDVAGTYIVTLDMPDATVPPSAAYTVTLQ